MTVSDLIEVLTPLGVFGGAFYLFKLKQEEVLKTRLALATELYEAFANLNEAIRDWAIPIAIDGENKDEKLKKQLAELVPKATSAFHRASLIMNPDIRARVRAIFDRVGEVLGAYQEHLAFRQANRDAPGAYAADLERSFREARTTMPNALNAAHQDLHRELEILVNGQFTAWRWRRRTRLLEKQLSEDKEHSRPRGPRLAPGPAAQPPPVVPTD